MTRHDDAQDQWNEDDPLVRALRAPGSPAELAHENEYVAAFRGQRPRGSLRRLAGRFGISATTAVTTVALTAGVAAAYGRVLPDPVQSFAHVVLGGIGVSAPAPVRSAADVHPPKVSATAPFTTAPPPGTTPSARPTAKPSAKPTGHPSPAVGPARGPTLTPPPATAPPGQPPGHPPVHRIPAALTIGTPVHRVAVGATVAVSGVVTSSDGHVLRKRAVRLFARSSTQPWTLVATGSTDGHGSVTLDSAALGRTTDLQLRTVHQVRSAVVRVVVVPVVVATLTEGSGTSSIAVTTQGCEAGDTVSVFAVRGGKMVRVASAQLDPSGSAVLSMQTPKHPVRIVVRLQATRQHASAQTSVKAGVTQ